VAVRSVGTRDPPAARSSQWLLRVFKGNSGVRYVPSKPSKKYDRVGEAVLPVIDLAGGGGRRRLCQMGQGDAEEQLGV